MYSKICEGEVIIAHEGVVTSDLISDVLADVEDNLFSSGVNVKIIRKAYNILVEALQNLFHHLEIPPQEFLKSSGLATEDKYAIFSMVKESKTLYKITTGNFIKSKDCRFLRDRIEQLNYLSQDELKELFKLVLNNDEFSAKGGGGLGFIEMARKSSAKFGYDFIEYDQSYSFFIFRVMAG